MSFLAKISCLLLICIFYEIILIYNNQIPDNLKKLLKISLTLAITVILVTGIIMPEIIMGTPASPAVGNWYQQWMPNLNGRQIVDITFLDSLTGYAISNRLTISDTSLILKTTDSGDNWFINYAQTGYIFKRIQFLNQNTGFVGGTGLIKTTNGGLNWNTINPSVFIEDLSFKSKDTGWYVYGESFTGGVFFTSDGGANWVQQYSAGSQNPEKIYMYNARIGFISDNSGSSSIRKTTNGGLNWNLNVSGQWYFDITFADSLTGWYSAASNIYKTTNGGNNWVLQNVPTGPDLLNLGINKLALINKDTVWAAGNAVFYPNSQVRAILLRTTNGGVNWQYQVPDTAINNFVYYFIQFADKNHGWAYTTLRGIHTATGGDPVWLTGINQISSQIPKEYKLFQNYPNPFNPETSIKYNVKSETSNVKLLIYDILGKQIEVLVDQKQNAGTYEVDFNGNGYASGVYFYKLIINSGKEVFTETKKMLMIK